MNATIQEIEGIDDYWGPAFRSVYEGEGHEAFVQQLDERIVQHDKEIEKLCNFHYQPKKRRMRRLRAKPFESAGASKGYTESHLHCGNYEESGSQSHGHNSTENKRHISDAIVSCYDDNYSNEAKKRHLDPRRLGGYSDVFPEVGNTHQNNTNFDSDDSLINGGSRPGNENDGKKDLDVESDEISCEEYEEIAEFHALAEKQRKSGSVVIEHDINTTSDCDLRLYLRNRNQGEHNDSQRQLNRFDRESKVSERKRGRSRGMSVEFPRDHSSTHRYSTSHDSSNKTKHSRRDDFDERNTRSDSRHSSYERRHDSAERRQGENCHVTSRLQDERDSGENCRESGTSRIFVERQANNTTTLCDPQVGNRSNLNTSSDLRCYLKSKLNKGDDNGLSLRGVLNTRRRRQNQGTSGLNSVHGDDVSSYEAPANKSNYVRHKSTERQQTRSLERHNSRSRGREFDEVRDIQQRPLSNTSQSHLESAEDSQTTRHLNQLGRTTSKHPHSQDHLISTEHHHDQIRTLSANQHHGQNWSMFTEIPRDQSRAISAEVFSQSSSLLTKDLNNMPHQTRTLHAELNHEQSHQMPIEVHLSSNRPLSAEEHRSQISAWSAKHPYSQSHAFSAELHYRQTSSLSTEFHYNQSQALPAELFRNQNNSLPVELHQTRALSDELSLSRQSATELHDGESRHTPTERHCNASVHGSTTKIHYNDSYRKSAEVQQKMSTVYNMSIKRHYNENRRTSTERCHNESRHISTERHHSGSPQDESHRQHNYTTRHIDSQTSTERHRGDSCHLPARHHGESHHTSTERHNSVTSYTPVERHHGDSRYTSTERHQSEKRHMPAERHYSHSRPTSTVRHNSESRHMAPECHTTAERRHSDIRHTSTKRHNSKTRYTNAKPYYGDIRHMSTETYNSENYRNSPASVRHQLDSRMPKPDIEPIVMTASSEKCSRDTADDITIDAHTGRSSNKKEHYRLPVSDIEPTNFTTDDYTDHVSNQEEFAELLCRKEADKNDFNNDPRSKLSSYFKSKFTCRREACASLPRSGAFPEPQQSPSGELRSHNHVDTESHSEGYNAALRKCNTPDPGEENKPNDNQSNNDTLAADSVSHQCTRSTPNSEVKSGPNDNTSNSDTHAVDNARHQCTLSTTNTEIINKLDDNTSRDIHVADCARHQCTRSTPNPEVKSGPNDNTSNSDTHAVDNARHQCTRSTPNTEIINKPKDNTSNSTHVADGLYHQCTRSTPNLEVKSEPNDNASNCDTHSADSARHQCSTPKLEVKREPNDNTSEVGDESVSCNVFTKNHPINSFHVHEGILTAVKSEPNDELSNAVLSSPHKTNADCLVSNNVLVGCQPAQNNLPKVGVLTDSQNSAYIMSPGSSAKEASLSKMALGQDFLSTSNSNDATRELRHVRQPKEQQSSLTNRQTIQKRQDYIISVRNVEDINLSLQSKVPSEDKSIVDINNLGQASTASSLPLSLFKPSVEDQPLGNSLNTAVVSQLQPRLAVPSTEHQTSPLNPVPKVLGDHRRESNSNLLNTKVASNKVASDPKHYCDRTEPINVPTIQESKSTDTEKAKSLPNFNPANKNHRITTWINTINEIAVTSNWTDEQVVELAMSKLAGNAKRWYKGFSSKFTWEEWQNKLKAAFPFTENYGKMLSDMLNKTMKTGNSLEDYYSEKMAMLKRCDIKGKKAVECIVFGIEDESVRNMAEEQNFFVPDELLEYLLEKQQSNY